MMDEPKGQASVDIGPDGMMVVSVNLSQQNAEIIALGILEKAKQSASAWLFQKHMMAKELARAGASQQKGLIDRLLRRNGGH